MMRQCRGQRTVQDQFNFSNRNAVCSGETLSVHERASRSATQDIRTSLLSAARGLLLHRPIALWAMAVIALISGCGEDPTADLGEPLTVTGTVTMDGAPAEGLEVVFARQDTGAPPEARNFSGMTDASGKYTVENMYPATYHVSIYDRKPVDEENISAVETGPYEKYGVNSELSATIQSGQTDASFDLTSQ